MTGTPFMISVTIVDRLSLTRIIRKSVGRWYKFRMLGTSVNKWSPFKLTGTSVDSWS